MFRFLANLFSGKAPTGHNSTCRASLAVECLEERELLSTTAVYYINTAHTMRETFRTDWQINFRPDGSVSGGYLAKNDWEWTDTGHRQWATFKADTWLYFRPDGSTYWGTLAFDQWNWVNNSH